MKCNLYLDNITIRTLKKEITLDFCLFVSLLYVPRYCNFGSHCNCIISSFIFTLKIELKTWRVEEF